MQDIRLKPDQHYDFAKPMDRGFELRPKQPKKIKVIKKQQNYAVDVEPKRIEMQQQSPEPKVQKPVVPTKSVLMEDYLQDKQYKKQE